jgi:hypothetical protein
MTARATYSETVRIDGTDYEVSAINLTGGRRYGTRYAVRVAGATVAIVTWKGGRRYQVTHDGTPPGGWEYVTPGGGKVSDVASYVARCHVSENPR